MTIAQHDRHTAVRRVRDHLFQADPDRTRTGYWVGLTGVVLTIAMLLISPDKVKDPIGKIPPVLIFAGLAIELLEKRNEEKQQ